MRVLVIEDHAEIANIYAVLMKRQGHDIRCVAEDFEEWLQPEPWIEAAADVVILDLFLPGVPGRALLRVAHVLTPRPRIVVATAAEHIDPEVALLADEVVRKPFGLEQLLEAIGQEAT